MFLCLSVLNSFSRFLNSCVCVFVDFFGCGLFVLLFRLGSMCVRLVWAVGESAFSVGLLECARGWSVVTIGV